MHATLPLPIPVDVPELEGLVTFPGLPSERTPKKLADSADVLIRSVSSVLDELVMRCIDQRTASGFESTRHKCFPKYYGGVRALSDLARIVVPKHLAEELANEFFADLEAEFHDSGEAAFGSAVRDQALFTVWTLRKVNQLCQRISSANLEDGLRKDDREMFAGFVINVIWTRFHLHCLESSLRSKKPIYPEVLDHVLDGLRAAVNTYAWARRALDLRLPQGEPLMSPVEWDEEDQQLLDEATRDTSAGAQEE